MSRRLLTAVLLLPLALAGCTPNTATSDPNATPAATGDDGGSAKKGTIGVSVLTMTNPFFKVIADTIEAEAAKEGYDVVVTSGEFDVDRQQRQIKDFIVQKVTAIALSPCDSRAIGPAIQEAHKAGIPVFTFDIGVLAPEAEVVSHIATDNYGGGRQAGVAMIEVLGEAGGNVVILDLKAVESCIRRVEGFKDEINAYNKDRTSGLIEVVAELPGDGQKDKGHKAAEDALQAHPDLAGIFAINDPSALGARAALEKANKADQVKLIGFDGQPEGKQAIKEGKIYADPVQYPDRIGQMTFATIKKYLDGEDVPANQPIATGLYRQADALADPELK